MRDIPRLWREWCDGQSRVLHLHLQAHGHLSLIHQPSDLQIYVLPRHSSCSCLRGRKTIPEETLDDRWRGQDRVLRKHGRFGGQDAECVHPLWCYYKKSGWERDGVGQVVHGDESRLCRRLVKIGIRQDSVRTTPESIRAPAKNRSQTRFCSLPSSFHYEGEELVEHKFFLDIQPTSSENIEETQLLALILTSFCSRHCAYFANWVWRTSLVHTKKTGGSEPFGFLMFLGWPSWGRDRGSRRREKERRRRTAR